MSEMFLKLARSLGQCHFLHCSVCGFCMIWVLNFLLSLDAAGVCDHLNFEFVAQFSKWCSCDWESKSWLGNFTCGSHQIPSNVRCHWQEQEGLFDR